MWKLFQEKTPEIIAILVPSDYIFRLRDFFEISFPNFNSMKKLLIVLPATSILFFSCTTGGGSLDVYRDLHFVSGTTGYITEDKAIYKTQDGGNTWSTAVSLVSNYLIEVHFIDANHGWACGLKGTILKYSP